MITGLTLEFTSPKLLFSIANLKNDKKLRYTDFINNDTL